MASFLISFARLSVTGDVRLSQVSQLTFADSGQMRSLLEMSSIYFSRPPRSKKNREKKILALQDCARCYRDGSEGIIKFNDRGSVTAPPSPAPPMLDPFSPCVSGPGLLVVTGPGGCE